MQIVSKIVDIQTSCLLYIAQTSLSDRGRHLRPFRVGIIFTTCIVDRHLIASSHVFFGVAAMLSTHVTNASLVTTLERFLLVRGSGVWDSKGLWCRGDRGRQLCDV